MVPLDSLVAGVLTSLPLLGVPRRVIDCAEAGLPLLVTLRPLLWLVAAVALSLVVRRVEAAAHRALLSSTAWVVHPQQQLVVTNLLHQAEEAAKGLVLDGGSSQAVQLEGEPLPLGALHQALQL